MKNPVYYKKITADIFIEQFKWSVWFFTILVSIHVAVLFFNLNNSNEIIGFFEFSSYSVAIFTFVSGIMASYTFMTRFVQQGISRKHVFLGITLASFGLSLLLTLLSLIITGIEFLLTSYTSLPLTFVSYGSTADWIMEIAAYLLNVYTFYLAGWLISIGYYRFGWLIGFGFIGLAVITLGLNDYFLDDTVTLNAFFSFIPENPLVTNPALAFGGALILIAVLLVAMRFLTRRVVIKMS